MRTIVFELPFNISIMILSVFSFCVGLDALVLAVHVCCNVSCLAISNYFHTAIKLPILPYTCATCFDLPSYISTMHYTVVFLQGRGGFRPWVDQQSRVGIQGETRDKLSIKQRTIEMQTYRQTNRQIVI